MDWFKVETRIATHEKVHGLSDGAFRALINCWAHAAHQENGGRVPADAARGLIPRVTAARLRELEAGGFIHANGTGWVIHDWDEHQADAEALSRLRANARKRKAAERAKRREGDE